jgi:hypothetical protein
MKPVFRTRFPSNFRLAVFAIFALAVFPSPRALAAGPQNLFANPSFELGREGWAADKAGHTECQFSVDNQEAAEGQFSALLKIGAVEEWGVQFGQSFPAGEPGKTYTFAVFAKSAGAVEAGLQIERRARPWDRAAGAHFKLTSQWQELHLTFTVAQPFPEGWFAYLSCTQPNARLRADMFRLYEGPYVPLAESVKQELATVGVRVLDTGAASPAPLAGEALSKRAGWAEVPEDNVTHAFTGEAVFMNDRAALVLRRGARGAEFYSIGHGDPALRAVLSPSAGGGVAKLSSLKLVENTPASAAVDAVFTAGDGQALTWRCELRMGQPLVQTEARAGVDRLRVEAPCRFAVLPDFFADDIVIDAAELRVARAELPSDNFLLHLLPDRQAMVMTVAQTSEEDLRIDLSGQGEQRQINASELRYGKGKIWVAILTAPALWHLQTVSREQAGQVVPLDWRAPFPAQWRVDWRRDKGLTDSWEMLTEKTDGSFAKYGLFGGPDSVPADRRRWTTVLGTFFYPAWVARDGRGYLQPIKSPQLRFEGPAIIYPVNRAPATPLDTFTVIDLVRGTLGVGPCEYVLDVEAQQSQYKGRATCSVRDTLNPIYAAKQQKQRRAEIDKVLQDLMIFIRHIRDRIEGYVAFGHETLAYLARQKQAHPELAGRLAELEALARGIDAKVAARRVKIKTPDEAAKMVAEFRQTVLDYEGEDAPARCQRMTAAWVDIGGNQDELVGECRWAVKMVRQKAGLMLAEEPSLAEVAKEIRRRSQLVLRNPAGHEGARH